MWGEVGKDKTTVLEKINLVTFHMLKRKIKDKVFKPMNIGVD